jgi:sugar O-acyltransferase (sialic acid O-acetyltransferase NeuD family)
MSSLLIAGAGGHGRVVADLAEESGMFPHICFLDDRFPQLEAAALWPVVGTLASLPDLRDRFDAFIAAFGDAALRLVSVQQASQNGYSTRPLVHPRAFVSRHATLAAGSVVCAGAVISVGAELGMACIVNTGATVDHDCRLGDGVHVCPGAHLAGGVTVGPKSWVGIGASVKQGVVIGTGVTIGAGAACTGNIPDGATVTGVPAREQRLRN